MRMEGGWKEGDEEDGKRERIIGKRRKNGRR